ncbi:hypothetical protein FQA39_LY10942 [Lamprigera yunnana]|nr:hypothetical protein FQA39_LY10942 [Lamprigera yunnana]
MGSFSTYLVLTIALQVCVGDPHQICLDSTNIKDSDLYTALTNEETPLDSNFGKYFYCFWHLQGVMNEDDSINFERLQKFGEEELNKIRDVTDDDCKKINEKINNSEILNAYIKSYLIREYVLFEVIEPGHAEALELTNKFLCTPCFAEEGWQVEEALESAYFQKCSQKQVESSEERGASVGSVESAFAIYGLPLYLLKFSVYNLHLVQVIIDAVNKASMYRNVQCCNSTIRSVTLALTTKGCPKFMDRFKAEVV